MRYLKWGIARLILESEPCPTVVPIWIEGLEEVMHESRPWPRFLPRFGRKVSVTFGEPVSETVWHGFRERWQRMKARDMPAIAAGAEDSGVGLLNEKLMDGEEARKLRTEVAQAVRVEMLKLRRGRGWPDEDPKMGFADTYREEGGKKTRGKMEDGSWVGNT